MAIGGNKMSTFEIQPKQPRIDIEKFLGAVKDWHACLERPLPKLVPISESQEEFISAPGVYEVITGSTQCFKPLKTITNLEWLAEYIKLHTLDTRGFSLMVSPQPPTVDTTISIKNVIHSITLEIDSLIDVFKIPIDAFIHSHPVVMRPDPTVHHNFIQPQEYYLKDIKIEKPRNFVSL